MQLGVLLAIYPDWKLGTPGGKLVFISPAQEFWTRQFFRVEGGGPNVMLAS